MKQVEVTTVVVIEVADALDDQEIAQRVKSCLEQGKPMWVACARVESVRLLTEMKVAFRQ